MRAERFGSYSMASTRAGMSILSLEVDDAVLALVPATLVPHGDRPAVVAPRALFLSGAVSERSGLDLVIVSNAERVIVRREGVVGLCVLMAISLSSAY